MPKLRKTRDGQRPEMAKDQRWPKTRDGQRPEMAKDSQLFTGQIHISFFP